MDTNDYFAKLRTYDQVLAEAKKIHPDMKVRLAGTSEDEWEMYMPTPYTEHFELDAKYKGTAAWEWYESRDSSYDNELQRYRYKQGYRNLPLDGVAEIINLKAEQDKWANRLGKKMHKENGSAIAEKEWATIGQERFTAWKETQRELEKLTVEEFKDKWEALREKWEF